MAVGVFPALINLALAAAGVNLPFVGHCTFAKQPACLSWDSIKADVAVLGAPFDMGTQYRAGARFGPRAIREASTLFSFGHGGAYDHEDDATYLPTDQVTIVDIGDANIIHTDTIKSHDNIETGVRHILHANALPLVLGGDHSVHIPCIRAFDGLIQIIHIDAISILLMNVMECATAMGILFAVLPRWNT